MPLRVGFFLVQAYARELRIGEKGIGDLPTGCNVVATCEVVPDHAEVVNADVGELRTSALLRRSPTRRARLSRAARSP